MKKKFRAKKEEEVQNYKLQQQIEAERKQNEFELEKAQILFSCFILRTISAVSIFHYF
jgi:hypothetical protein